MVIKNNQISEYAYKITRRLVNDLLDAFPVPTEKRPRVSGSLLLTVGVARRGCRLFWAGTPERLQPEEILLSVTATGASFTRLLAVLLGPKDGLTRRLFAESGS